MPEPHLPRRTALALGLGSVLAAGGCGLRLEDDARPRREPVSGQAPLLVVLGALATSKASLDAPRAQALRAALARHGVPAADLDRAAARCPTRAEIIKAHEGAVGDCPIDLLPLMGSLLAARMIATDPDTPWTPSGDGAWAMPGAAGAALVGTRAAVWALTVVRAQGGGSLTTASRATLEVLERLQTRQVTAADDDGGAATLGYDLDAPVTDERSGRALAETTLTRLTTVYARVLPDLDRDRAAAREVARWIAVVARTAQRRWSIDPVAFPGLDPAGTAPTSSASPSGASATSAP